MNRKDVDYPQFLLSFICALNRGYNLLWRRQQEVYPFDRHAALQSLTHSKPLTQCWARLKCMFVHACISMHMGMSKCMNMLTRLKLKLCFSKGTNKRLCKPTWRRVLLLTVVRRGADAASLLIAATCCANLCITQVYQLIQFLPGGGSEVETKKHGNIKV